MLVTDTENEIKNTFDLTLVSIIDVKEELEEIKKNIDTVIIRNQCSLAGNEKSINYYQHLHNYTATIKDIIDKLNELNNL